MTIEERFTDLEERFNSQEELFGSFMLLVAKQGEDLKHVQDAVSEIAKMSTGLTGIIKGHSDQIKELREGQKGLLSISTNLSNLIKK